MQLIKLYANQPSFKTVHFKECGLNFILAKQKKPEESEKGKTYNGVGKSLIVRIIHFCLGSGSNNYLDFQEKLKNWEFYLDFKLKNNLYTIRRSPYFPNKIYLNEEEFKIDQFNKLMAELCFYIPNDASNLSFRSLIPFFIRPDKQSYLLFNKTGKLLLNTSHSLITLFCLA